MPSVNANETFSLPPPPVASILTQELATPFPNTLRVPPRYVFVDRDGNYFDITMRPASSTSGLPLTSSEVLVPCAGKWPTTDHTSTDKQDCALVSLSLYADSDAPHFKQLMLDCPTVMQYYEWRRPFNLLEHESTLSLAQSVTRCHENVSTSRATVKAHVQQHVTRRHAEVYEWVRARDQPPSEQTVGCALAHASSSSSPPPAASLPVGEASASCSRGDPQTSTLARVVDIEQTEQRFVGLTYTTPLPTFAVRVQSRRPEDVTADIPFFKLFKMVPYFTSENIVTVTKWIHDNPLFFPFTRAVVVTYVPAST